MCNCLAPAVYRAVCFKTELFVSRAHHLSNLQYMSVTVYISVAPTFKPPPLVDVTANGHFLRLFCGQDALIGAAKSLVARVNELADISTSACTHKKPVEVGIHAAASRIGSVSDVKNSFVFYDTNVMKVMAANREKS